MIKVVAFDLDDTLWHVDPVIINAEKALKSWLQQAAPGFTYVRQDLQVIRQNIVSEDETLAHRLTELRRRTLEIALKAQAQKDAVTLADQAMEVFLDARNKVAFFEGAVETIADIGRDFELGALTNGNADIHRLGLQDHFSFAFSAEEVGAPKPAPDLFHRALSHTGCKPGEMVYVGDDPIKDVDAANEVGLFTIWVRGERRPEPGATQADQTVDDIRDLPSALTNLLRYR